MTPQSAKLYRYVLEHDAGFAPNPFHGWCTLAACKPDIRRTAKVGDFILGFGGAAISGVRYKLIYWMLVEETTNFDDYWNDARFQRKKPIVNGSDMVFHGDNIYHREGNGFVQAHSYHSYPDGSAHLKHFHRDTGRTDRVLISKTFGYYGKSAIALPEALKSLVASGRPVRINCNDEIKSLSIRWLLDQTPRGYAGEPYNWK